MLSRVPQLSDVVPITLHHHEDWIGSGYPIGISGERIPIGARIIRICDTYDALTSDRPYRAAYPLAEALKALAAVRSAIRSATGDRLRLHHAPATGARRSDGSLG